MNTLETSNSKWRHVCFEEQSLFDDIHTISNIIFNVDNNLFLYITSIAGLIPSKHLYIIYTFI